MLLRRDLERVPRTVASLVLAILVSFGAVLTTPRPVVACSCVGFSSLADVSKANTAAFTGTAGGIEGRGVAVRVDRWFWGRGPAPTVWLAMSSFGDGAACGTTEPPPGSSWLWVAWPADDGTFGTGLCSPSARLDTAEGQALLKEASAIVTRIQPEPKVPSEDQANGAPVDDAAAAARDLRATSILGALVVGSVALFGGIVLLARRSAARAQRRDGRP